jgi:hypothetical protein
MLSAVVTIAKITGGYGSKEKGSAVGLVGRLNGLLAISDPDNTEHSGEIDPYDRHL